MRKILNDMCYDNLSEGCAKLLASAVMDFPQLNAKEIAANYQTAYWESWTQFMLENFEITKEEYVEFAKKTYPTDENLRGFFDATSEYIKKSKSET